MDTLKIIASMLVMAGLLFLSWLTVHQALLVMQWQCEQVIRISHCK